jgi:murein DD-endopeptidase MepM/ murein hydrolase activator NlpD
MAAGTGGGARAGTLSTSERRRSKRRDRVLQALCCLLLVLCSGCGSSADEVTVSSRGDPSAFLPGEPAPLMARSLLLKPVDRGRLTSAYGTRYNPFSKRRQMHQGIDWAAPRGTMIRAAGDGVVVAAGRHGSYGHYLRIDHGGTIETAYAHLERYAPRLRPGHTVRQGDEVGRVGSTGRATGPHLHYEVMVAGRRIDPLAFASAAPAPASGSADPASGSAADEFGIGGPDIAEDAGIGDPGAQHDDTLSPMPEAIDGSAVIWIDDLLSHDDR